MSSNFGQIPLLTTVVAALERLKNRCHHRDLFSVTYDQIHFEIVGNKDMHNISDKFDPPTNDYGVICP